MNFDFSDTASIARLRFKLLIRQRLGWISIGVGCFLVLTSLVIARVSYLSPLKIFLDFGLGAIFLLQMSLAVLLGSQLFSDEKSRRTLHLLLSSGVSRFGWVVGNALGIWAGLTLMCALWAGLTWALSAVVFPQSVDVAMGQALILMVMESLLVVLMSMLASFMMRPLLALVATGASVVFLHSITSLQRIFTDPQVGVYTDDRGLDVVLWAARLLPPLEWFDLKLFVGYVAQVPWIFVAKMCGIGLMWAILLAAAAWYRFERMDL